MNKLKNFIICICVPYTILIVVLSILVKAHVFTFIDENINIENFIIVIFISASRLFIEKIDFSNILFNVLIDLFAIFFIVFIFDGVIFKMFEISNFKSNTIISAIILMVYAISYFVLYQKDKNDADKINKILLRNKNMEENKWKK